MVVESLLTIQLLNVLLPFEQVLLTFYQSFKKKKNEIKEFYFQHLFFFEFTKQIIQYDNREYKYFLYEVNPFSEYCLIQVQLKNK